MIFFTKSLNYRWLSVWSQSREQRIRGRFREAVEINVVPQRLYLHLLEPNCCGNVADSRTADGGRSFFPAKDFWGDEDVDFVNLASVKQGAEELRTSLDQNIRHPPAAEFIEELERPLVAGFR